VILYEYPFNERVRSLLRLEYMFDRLCYFAQPGDARLHQVAVATLFDMLDLTERSDVKGAVLQDIDRQRAALTALRDHPEVATQALETTLSELAHAASQLAASERTGQTLRDHEWLASLRGRVSMPGGATQMDIPSYHAWQMRDVATRCTDLQAWLAPLQPLCDGVKLVLRLLREGGNRTSATATNGCFQQMLAGKTWQLLRVWVGEGENGFPEISANKYMVWIRFASQGPVGKPQPIARDMPFEMALCNV